MLTDHIERLTHRQKAEVMSKIALVRRPGPLLDDGIVDHIEKVAVDLSQAIAQWEGYVAALRDAGWEVPYWTTNFYPGMAHCENDWASRLFVPLMFLLGK